MIAGKHRTSRGSHGERVREIGQQVPTWVHEQTGVSPVASRATTRPGAAGVSLVPELPGGVLVDITRREALVRHVHAMQRCGDFLGDALLLAFEQWGIESAGYDHPAGAYDEWERILKPFPWRPDEADTLSRLIWVERAAAVGYPAPRLPQWGLS